MSYIPDYRSEENEKYLNETDKAFLEGYRAGLADSTNFFYNADEMYECSEEEIGVLLEALECFKDYTNVRDIEATCSVFENADYIPEDVDIKDMNEPMYKNTKGAESNGD